MIKLLFFILTVVTYIYAAPLQITNTITLSSTTLCMFLPREYGGDIGASESDAVAFCNTTNDPKAPNVNLFPEGFITAANYATGNGFVQFTGTIDRSKYGLSSGDGGGQYDNANGGSPPDAKCEG